ncbi:Actin-related protein 5 [Saitoella coloradoensis]
MSEARIYDVREPVFPGPTEVVDYSSFRGTSTPIVIDNGSWNLRAGYATDTTPRFSIESLYAKHRDRRLNKTYQLVGNDIVADPLARLSAKSPFDGPIVSNYEIMEGILDYVFLKLGVEGSAVDHPIVMTEVLGNPAVNRRSMNEVLFELYGVQSAAYGIDSLFSFHANNGKDGLVISTGNNSTNIVPVVNGKGVLSLAKRLNWGATQAATFLQSLMALKYPNFPQKLSLEQATLLLQDHCYVSQESYAEELRTYITEDTLTEKDRIIQFPYTEMATMEKTQEEIDRLAEQRKASGRRLQEQAAAKRAEKLQNLEREMSAYQELKLSLNEQGKRDGKKVLEAEGFEDEAALDKVMKKLEAQIRKLRNKSLGLEEEEEEPEVPSFPLLDVPDEDLDEAAIKQKRQQKMQKANYDARMRLKVEKEAERQRIRDEEAADELKRTTALDEWLATKRAAREELLQKVNDRKRLKAELSDRKSMASQMRMKSLANLASDNPSGKKRRRGGDDDGFGMDDADWGVYRDVGDIDSEDEEDDTAELKKLEASLLKHDPEFVAGMEHDAAVDPRDSLVYKFLRGVHPQPWQSDNLAHAHQLHLNVERIRVPEVPFQPGIAGLDQASIIEIAKDILSRLEPSPRASVVKDVFVTGGLSLLPNYRQRMEHEVRGILPIGTDFNVRQAHEPLNDAWRGAAMWASKGDELKKCLVTRQEYLEMGGDYMKEHGMGNALES